MAETRKKRIYQKVTPKTLDRPIFRKRMIQRIQATGKEAECWKGICDVRTYRRFTKTNAEWWPNAVNRAIKVFYNDEQFLDPKFIQLNRQRIVQRVYDDKASIGEMLKIDQYVRDLRKDHLPG